MKKYPKMKDLEGLKGIEYLERLKADGTLDQMLEEIGNKLRSEVGSSVDGRLTYSQISKVQLILLNHFIYISDDSQYEKADFWDPTSYMDAMFAFSQNGKFKGDCDSYGYAILGILYYVFRYNKKDLYRVACGTETGEGHFVAWARSSDGYLYQVENRLQEPKSVKFMRDKGYEFWDYSPMTRVDKWFKAESFVSKEIYNTPNNLESDCAEFTVSKAISVHKSKTLVKEWFQLASGAAISTVSVVTTNPDAIASTIQANQGDLSQFIDGKFIGLFIAGLGLVGIYLRTITNKDVDHKDNYDH